MELARCRYWISIHQCMSLKIKGYNKNIIFCIYIDDLYKNVMSLLEKLIEREIKESSIEDLVVERD